MASYVGCRRERERGPEALKKEGQAMKKIRIMVLALMVMALMAGLLPWAAVSARAEGAIVLTNGTGSVTLESGKTYIGKATAT